MHNAPPAIAKSFVGRGKFLVEVGLRRFDGAAVFSSRRTSSVAPVHLRHPRNDDALAVQYEMMSRRTPKRTASPLGEKRPSARWSSDRRAYTSRGACCGSIPSAGYGFRRPTSLLACQHPLFVQRGRDLGIVFPSRKRDRMIATAFGEVVEPAFPVEARRALSLPRLPQNSHLRPIIRHRDRRKGHLADQHP